MRPTAPPCTPPVAQPLTLHPTRRVGDNLGQFPLPLSISPIARHHVAGEGEQLPISLETWLHAALRQSKRAAARHGIGETGSLGPCGSIPSLSQPVNILTSGHPGFDLSSHTLPPSLRDSFQRDGTRLLRL